MSLHIGSEAPEQIEKILVNNLLFLLKTRNLTITQFAREIKIPRGTINNIINQKVIAPTIPLINKIAEFFEITIDQMIKHKMYDNKCYPDIFNKTFIGTHYKVPILDWHDTPKALLNITTTDQRFLFTEWLNLEVSTASNSFLFAMRSKSSYEPQFPSNSFLIFDHKIIPTDNHYVLVNDVTKSKTSLMKYFYDGNNEYISSISQEKKNIFVPENIKFLGVLSLVKLELK